MREMEIKLLYDLVDALESELPFGTPKDSLQQAADRFKLELSRHMEPETLEALEKLTEEKLAEEKRKQMKGVKEE